MKHRISKLQFTPPQQIFLTQEDINAQKRREYTARGDVYVPKDASEVLARDVRPERMVQVEYCKARGGPPALETCSTYLRRLGRSGGRMCGERCMASYVKT